MRASGNMVDPPGVGLDEFEEEKGGGIERQLRETCGDESQNRDRRCYWGNQHVDKDGDHGDFTGHQGNNRHGGKVRGDGDS